MKKYYFLSLLVLFTGTIFSQLKIDDSGRTGLGGNPNIHAQYTINKETGLAYGTRSISEFTVFSNDNSGTYNKAFSTSSNVPVTGIYNIVQNTGSNYALAYYNEVQAGGSGSKVAFRNRVSDDNPAGSSSANWMNGFDIRVTHKYYPKAWGSKIVTINNNTNSNDETYGQEIVISGSGAAKSVGLKVVVPSGANNYAAQFTGPVTVNGSLVLTSDLELKQNILDIPEALSIITSLSPKTYEFRGDTRFNFNPEEKQFGFLAQEVEEILPSLVKDIYHSAVYRPDYFKGMVGPDGEEMSEEEGMLHPATTYKAVKYIDFIPIIVQAMKEQQLEIELLNDILDNPLPGVTNRSNGNERRVEALEQENLQLKADLIDLSDVVNELRAEMASLKECTDCFGHRKQVESDLLENVVSIYPNPARSQVTINTKLDGEYQVKVLTSDGRLLTTDKYASRVVTLNTSSWTAGSYIFEVVTLDGTIADRIQVVIMK